MASHDKKLSQLLAGRGSWLRGKGDEPDPDKTPTVVPESGPAVPPKPDDALSDDDFDKLVDEIFDEEDDEHDTIIDRTASIKTRSKAAREDAEAVLSRIKRRSNKD